MQAESVINLRLSLAAGSLLVQVVNRASTALELWELENSWGWYSFSVHLRGRGRGERVVIERSSRDWTRNIPSRVTIAPRGTWDVRLNIRDGWWNEPRGLNDLRHEAVLVHVVYSVARTRESDEFGVVVGTTGSNEVISSPPHEWLPIEK